MKLVHGIYLPDSDEHFEYMMSKAPLVLHHGRMVGTYQINKLQHILAITKKRRIAIDCGAHCGFFSMWLADEFRRVYAFEPVMEHADCFARNVTQQNVTLHRCAVGASSGMIRMKTDAENSGKARIGGRGHIPMVCLDDLQLQKVDCIKIDVEGFESEVIEGAQETIKACKPVIMLEQNGDPDGVETLMEMGMRVHMRIGSDWIMKW